ncbi:peptide ABC transporter ATP-binding protein [Candidatus Poribacteria bacterium]|nr:peptide ABC transporter ATP-binding protein [Candidatus Poribacteria bacterium]
MTLNHSQSKSSILLSVDKLTKIFKIQQGLSSVELTAVDGANFSIRSDQPEIFVLAGESGSGKTTIARMILGLVEPTSGTILYQGRDITKLSQREKKSWYFRQVQPIFQNPFATFSPLKKIETYLFETALNYHIVDKIRLHSYVNEVLNSVGLSLAEIGGRYPNELSGGQAQRVSIARALITNPTLLVADEPVSMVDASLRMSIVNLFRELRDKKGVTILYITHDLATAYYAADRIAVMLAGWIIESGSVEQVLGDPQHPYTQNLKQSIPTPDPDKKWNDLIRLEAIDTNSIQSGGCKYVGRCSRETDLCRTKIPIDFNDNGRHVKCLLPDINVNNEVIN